MSFYSASSVNGKTSNKSMTKQRDGCGVKVLTHQLRLQRASSIIGKTTKKSMADRVLSPPWVMIFCEDLPFKAKRDAAC